MNEKTKNSVELMTKSIEIRGRILERASITEMLMACVIAKYFTEGKDAENELLINVLCTKNFSFDTKRDLLKTVLSKPRYDNFEHIAELNKMIEDAVKVRNVLAHQVLDTSSESIDSFNEMDTFTYMRFNKSIQVAKYSGKEIHETEKSLVKANEYLKDLYENY